MSLASEKSPKHCAIKQSSKLDKRYKKLFLAASALLSSISLLILILWLLLHPWNPQFSLNQAQIYQLNLIDRHLLNSTIQFTLAAKNPNHKLGVYYDPVRVYAVYKGQQITLDSWVPGFFQGNGESSFLTAFLAGGGGVPVAPSFGFEVGRDQRAGRFVMNVKAVGRLRWKFGSWVSGRYRFDVDCVAVLPFGPTIPAAPLSLKQPTRCSISI